jgi:hypothetical protein
MGGINTGRWLGGGVVAGLIMWVIEGAASVLYMDDMEVALEAHNLAAMEMSAWTVIFTLAVSLIAGLVLIFLYAAARPRFGPGPKTAVIVAVVMWISAYLFSLLGYQMLGLYPGSMLVTWGVIGIVEIVIAALVGGWIYREAGAAAGAA